MRILKIRGKEETIIKDQIEKEYGNKAVIISTQIEKREGFLGLFKKPSYCITIAVDDGDPKQTEKETAHEVMLEIKEELQKMRRQVEEVKVMTNHNETKESARTINEVLAHSLIEEGVAPEVVEMILEGISHNTTLEEIARNIYERLTTMLLECPKDNGEHLTFFIGTTGVGKTTTIAKLTAEYVLTQKKEVVLLTADTYRIAAIEQLNTYADILDVPIEVVYSKQDLKHYIDKWDGKQHIIVDTAGRSHKNSEQLDEMKELLDTVENKKVYLVMNMSTNYRDVKRIVDIYKGIVEKLELIITKIDETDQIGQLINIGSYAKCPIAYVTTGQNVPDDIELFNQDEYVKQLLGRIKYE